MLKALAGFVAGLVFVGIVMFTFAMQLFFHEIESPFGMEETAARIQQNVQSLSHKGWSLSGLRDPSAAVASAGGNVPPVLLVEACSTKYSGPILGEDKSRILSILMPCTITVYKKDNGKTYIGLMNAGLMGHMFGVGDIMSQVAEDQKVFVTFDPNQPAPALIRSAPGGGAAGGGKQGSGC